MIRAGTGLVIGKYLPPHAGHVGLFEFAGRQARELWILVCDSPRYSIPASLRAEWISRLAPRANVLVVEERHADDDSQGWAQRTKEVLGFVPEKVFTSEKYGDAYCGFLGSTHVSFDPGRKQFPVSGTRVRENPLAFWEWIPGPVRSHFARRVAIVGPESTGKTTLAQALSTHFKTLWVPEYGRTYWEERKLGAEDWREDDFRKIAAEQNRLEDSYAEKCDRLLFCDTHALCTQVWRRRYLGSYDPALDALFDPGKYALTFFCEPDFPHVQDGTRDSVEYRAKMALWLKERLGAFTSLTGGPGEREKAAVVAIKRVFSIG